MDESGMEMDNFYFTTGILQGILERGHIIRDRGGQRGLHGRGDP